MTGLERDGERLEGARLEPQPEVGAELPRPPRRAGVRPRRAAAARHSGQHRRSGVRLDRRREVRWRTGARDRRRHLRGRSGHRDLRRQERTRGDPSRRVLVVPRREDAEGVARACRPVLQSVRVGTATCAICRTASRWRCVQVGDESFLSVRTNRVDGAGHARRKRRSSSSRRRTASPASARTFPKRCSRRSAPRWWPAAPPTRSASS